MIFALVFAAACSGDKDTTSATPDDPTVNQGVTASVIPRTSPTPFTTPGLSLTPLPGVQPDIETARQLEASGDIEQAVEVYVAITATNLPAREEAVLGAGRLLLELERPADARILLEPFMATATGQELAGHYLLARAYAALSLWAESLEQYDVYIQAGRPAVAYAYLDRSRILLELGRPLEAAESAESGVAEGVPVAARATFVLMVAQSFERAGDLDSAIDWYRILMELSRFGSDPAFALSRISALKLIQDDPTYSEDLLLLLGRYPSTNIALSELAKAVARGETIPPAVQGLIFYRHNEYSRAEPLFREQIALEPEGADSAEAYYYLAAIQEAGDDLDEALSNYARATALNPQSLIADDALWWRARILEQSRRLDEAEALLSRILDEYPASSWAVKAAFRRGMLPYVDQRYEEAAAFWADGLQTVTGSVERQRLALWQGKALLMAGDETAARAILEDLTRLNEDDYYGIRALSLLAGQHGQPRAVREPDINLEPDFDWPAAETWLSLKTGRPVVEAGWSDDLRWHRAQELWLVGRISQADVEAFSLMETYAQDPIAMYTMAQRLAGQGRLAVSARAGQRLLRFLDLNPNEGLPKALLSLSYPPAFGREAKLYADSEDVSPLLLLALVRQESFFDPRAESPVGALGLSQVLPSTGQSIAGDLNLTDFSSDQLLHAELNLRFGAYYLSEQLSSFDDEVYLAFAAYNAGPGAATRWRDTPGASDGDIFLEAVEFRETQLYIEFVAENYAIYRYLYGGEPVPSLPD